MTVTGNGISLSGRGRRPDTSRGAFFFVIVWVALLAAGAPSRAVADPLVPPPDFTATPLDNAVRLSWPRQPDSVLVSVGVADDGLDRWAGASQPIVSGLYTEDCDQAYVLQVLPPPLAQGKLVFAWEKSPPESISVAGTVEIGAAGRLYDMTSGIQVGLTPSNQLADEPSESVQVVRGAGLVDTLRFSGSWSGSGVAPVRERGLWLRQNEEGVFVFTATTSGTVLSGGTNPPGGITLNWDFYLSSADTVVRSGSVVIAQADLPVTAFFDSVVVLPPDTVQAPALSLELGTGTVTSGNAFAVQVRPSVVAEENKDSFLVSGLSFAGYDIWRSEVIDLDRPIFVGKIHRCDVPPESAAVFDLPVQEYIDREVHNGFPYYFSVTASDAEIDSIASDVWFATRQKVYPSGVAYDSTFTGGTSKFSDASKAHAVPNPYKLFEEWEEGGESKLQFIDLPPEATVYVYTESGDYVTSIRQEDSRSDRVDWDLKNGNGTKVVSGIYIFRVESPYGDKTGRFIIIR